MRNSTARSTELVWLLPWLLGAIACSGSDDSGIPIDVPGGSGGTNGGTPSSNGGSAIGNGGSTVPSSGSGNAGGRTGAAAGSAGTANGGRAGGASGAGGQVTSMGGAGSSGSNAGTGGRSVGGNSGVGGTAGASSGSTPPIPSVNGTCPTLKSGSATILGTTVQLWVGSKPGPMYFYWHATGQDFTEVQRGMPGATDGVATAGGIVASFAQTNGQGTNTGNGVWFTGDFDAADQILACGVQSGLVDTTRIYTAGYSAGGLQACAMVALRGRYLAAAICYSGGAATVSGTPRDTQNLPATLLLHGAAGSDTFVLDFNRASQTWASSYKAAGGFAINCDDGGDHIRSAATRLGFGGRAMTFFADHRYKNNPEPYAGGLPNNWPTYCQIVR